MASGDAEFDFFKKGLPFGSSVLVLGLGEGACLAELASAGLNVIAVDRDPARVAIARGLVPRAFVVAADVRDAVLPAADGVFVSSGILGDHSETFVSMMLARAASFLNAGGLLAASVDVRVGGVGSAAGWEGIRERESFLRRSSSAAGLSVVTIKREPSAKSGDLCRVVVLAKVPAGRCGGGRSAGFVRLVVGSGSDGGGNVGD
jgi:hypothetical protein